ncbi:MAG: transketolase C-terminal domain-containing protein [Akkermansia muciniphila]
MPPWWRTRHGAGSRSAADLLKESGGEVEVVDLRTVRPLDMDTVIASVARTGRVLVVGEDFRGEASRRKLFHALSRKASTCWMPASEAQRAGYPHPPAPQPLESAPPHAGIHSRLHPPSFIHLIQPSFHHA